MGSSATLTILLIEDNLGDYRLVREMLDESTGGRFILLHATQVSAAIPLLESEPIDVILLDLTLPDGSGLDTLIKVHALAPEVPIVVLSHAEDESMAVKAVRMGAQDFLVKSHISGLMLARSLRYALERRQLEEQLHRLAHHDALTDLPNRKLFYDRLANAVANARRHQRSMALMLLDLNDFKQVNDNYGHQVGDELLRETARRLDSALRATDCVARLGGDEFIIYISDLADLQHVAHVAQKILDSLAEPHVAGGRQFPIHCSLGIALHPDDGDDMETLVRHADTAMYAAKAQGGGGSRYRFYARELDAATTQRAELEKALRQAFAERQFVVNYQPQVDLHSGRMVGVEALLRWQKADGTLAMPVDFMPMLEESGLIVDVGEWVMATACAQVVAWHHAAGYPLKVAINLSPRQFRDSHLVERVSRALANSGLSPELLELELSEHCIKDDEQLALDILRRLNGLGVRLALDNYRGRVMSLRDLKRFPVHSIKLDRAIVRDITESPEDAAIAQAVISVAHVLKMKGIAEGVETQGQIDLLRQQSCDDAQGYMFARPLSADDFAALLRGASTGSYLQ